MSSGVDPTSSEPQAAEARHSRIISAVLTPAIRLWLRSQLDHVENLQVQLEAGDRQLLAGAIQQVTVSAEKAVYQGLHLSQAFVVSQQIRTNLGQVLRGKPIRLLESFPISGTVLLYETDLNTSLQAPLLSNAVIKFLLTLLEDDLDQLTQEGQSINLEQPQVVLDKGQITLTTTLVSTNGTATPVVFRAALQIEDGRFLKLDRPQWLPNANARQGLPLKDFNGFTFDLGSQIHLEELTLEAGRVFCRGQIWVMPED